MAVTSSKLAVENGQHGLARNSIMGWQEGFCWRRSGPEGRGRSWRGTCRNDGGF